MSDLLVQNAKLSNMVEKLTKIAEELSRRLRTRNRSGKTITLKIRYSDFSLQTRSRTLAEYIDSPERILAAARDLLYQQPLENSVRLLGISLSNLDTEKEKTESGEDSVSVQLKFEF